MLIAGYLKTSLIEWPGKIASVIFTPGCNFACPFCHNADLVDPLKIKKLEEISEKSVLENLEKRKKWIDGVVISGGEPTLQADLAVFLRKLKRLDFKTMVETNGSQPGVIKKLINQKLVDFLVMDYKTTFADYAKVVKFKTQSRNFGTKLSTKGRSSFGRKIKKDIDLVRKVKKSMKLILKSRLPFEFRTTVVPEIYDQKVLLQMAQDFKKLTSYFLSPTSIPWILQPFQPKNCLEPIFEKIKPFSRPELKKLTRMAQEVFPSLKLRN